MQTHPSLRVDICESRRPLAYQAVDIPALIVIGWPEKEKKDNILDHPDEKNEPCGPYRKLQMHMDDHKAQANQEHARKLDEEICNNGPSGPSCFHHIRSSLMKLALSSQGKTLDSVLSGFGRCRYFILYDTTTQDVSSVSNEGNMVAGRGAGTRTAQDVVKTGAGAVITSQIGPKAVSYLKGKEMPVHVSQAQTVEQAVQE
jgi:predicted Fe-Mo cluster-binding NifX family protein